MAERIMKVDFIFLDASNICDYPDSVDRTIF